MLSDYLSCKEETKEYETYLSTATDQITPASNFDFSIQCLKTANWPSFKNISLTMPQFIDDKFQQFNRFYTNKH